MSTATPLRPELGPPSGQLSPATSRLPLYMLIGLVIGIVAGLMARQAWPAGANGEPNATLAWAVTNVTEPIGQIFLRLIFMVVVPLIVSAIVLGVAELGDMRRLGRVGFATLFLTVVLSVISVMIGVGMANVVRPGGLLQDEARDSLRAKYESQAEDRVKQAREQKSVRDSLLDIIPKNPLRELVGATDGSSPGGGLIAVMFFALAIGIAIVASPARTGPLIGTLEGVFDVCMTIVSGALWIAPVAIAAMMFTLSSTLGPDLLRVLLGYVLTVVVALALHLFGVFSLLVWLVARRNPLRFFRDIGPAMLTAFATASSNVTLPLSLRVSMENLKLRPTVARFVLTVGATANQNGTALFEGVTVLFLAQAFGIELTLAQQVTVVIMCVLAGIGTAGVPAGSLPFIAIVLGMVHVPPQAIAIIIGVDRFLDMCRTVVNVAGDIAIAACIDRVGDDKRVDMQPVAVSTK